MADNLIIGCIPDWLQQSSVSVAAVSEASAAYEDDNLLTKRISQTWRSTGLTMDSGIVFDLFQERLWDNIGLVNHNLREGSYYRVGYSGLEFFVNSARERIAPSAITTHAGTLSDGAVGSIDEDVDDWVASADYARWTDASGDIEVSLDFATPATTPFAQAGTDLHVFRVVWRVNDSGALGTAVTIEGELREGGTLRQSLDSVTYSRGSGLTEAYFFWDAANLSTASGADVQFRFRLSVSGSGSIRVEAADWISTPDDGGGSTTYSAWMPVASAGLGWGGASLDEIAPGRILARTQPHIFSTPVSARYGNIEFLAVNNPDGYIEAGRLAVGRSFGMVKLSEDWGVSYVDQTRRIRTSGGQVFRRTRPGYRRSRLPLDSMTTAEGLVNLFNGLYRAIGSTEDFLVSIFPDSGDYLPIGSYWCHLPESENGVSGQTGLQEAGDIGRFSSALMVEETL